MAGGVPSGERGPHRAARVRRRHGSRAGRAVAELDGLAATFIDGGVTSDGVWTPSPEELAAVVRRHAVGGRAVRRRRGAGRATGAWASTSGRSPRHGITPDIVTLGKPMGNGYPVAAVITRREIVDRFPFAGTVFSTFGGNPVAAQAALAVLDVIEDERIVERVKACRSAAARSALASSAGPRSSRCAAVGLIIGVELTDAEAAGRVVDRLRQDGVLIGRTGKHENVLKIRPPLVFGDEHADILVQRARSRASVVEPRQPRTVLTALRDLG